MAISGNGGRRLRLQRNALHVPRNAKPAMQTPRRTYCSPTRDDVFRARESPASRWKELQRQPRANDAGVARWRRIALSKRYLRGTVFAAGSSAIGAENVRS